MSSVERNESGYVVTISEEEAGPLMAYWPATVTTWTKDLNRIGQAIADGLRACQPPPPPQPGDAVQYRNVGWATEDWVPTARQGHEVITYAGEFDCAGVRVHLARDQQRNVTVWPVGLWELRRDVRVGGGA